MLRTGVDLIEVSRIESSISRYGDRFTRKVFTEGEIVYSRGTSDLPGGSVSLPKKPSVNSLELAFSTVTASNGARWKWYPPKTGTRLSALIARRSAARQQLGIEDIALSFSHTHEHAIAFVVAIIGTFPSDEGTS